MTRKDVVEPLRPCARCEEELPESAFVSPDSPFCNRCTEEVIEIARNKYGIIEAAHLRARLRHQMKQRQNQQ